MQAPLYFIVLLSLAVLLSMACDEGGSDADTSPQPGVVDPQRPPAQQEVFPEVWSSNGYDGQTYEFKANCFGEFDILEACLLFDVTRVIVVGPNGTEFQLDKDFNINAYSGEVTRRWVIYGPSGHGLPKPGQYSFKYFQGGESVLEQVVDYTPEVVDFPREVSWQREGSDLVVSWTPPAGAKPGMWYKVLVFPEAGEVISLQFDWDVSEARLRDIPLKEGDVADVNVSVFFHGGYAYSDYIPLRWEVAQTSQGDDRLSRVEASAPPTDLFLPFRVEDVRGGSGFISPFGIIRHSRDAGHGHGGIDVPLSESAPVYAVADGIILSAERSSDGAGGFDVTLLIQGSDGEGWGFLYEHIMLKSEITVGDAVSKGQLIATNGLITDRRNNHFQLAYMFNGYMFSRDHRCWKDHLDPSSTETLLGYFDSVRASEEFITQWETAIEEGSKAYIELLNEDRFPEGPQLCYSLGLDVRS